MPDYHSAFFAGEHVVLADADVLADLEKRFGEFELLARGMATHAGKRVRIKRVSYYHFGTPLYEFDEPAGCWLEAAILDWSLTHPHSELTDRPAHLIYEATTDSAPDEPGMVSIRCLQDGKLFCCLHQYNAVLETRNINAVARLRTKASFEGRYGFHGDYPPVPISEA